MRPGTGARGCRPVPRVRAARSRRLPGVVRGGAGAVIGEVYQVDEATRAALDRLERHPRLYARTRIAIVDGTVVETCLLGPEKVVGCPVMLSGDWRAYRRDSDTGWGRDGADEVFPVGEGKRALSLTCVLGMG